MVLNQSSSNRRREGATIRSNRLERLLPQPGLRRIAAGLDRDLPVPVGVQLRGLIEYGIALGELQPGQRLPSVRELADLAQIAPMTVTGVYRDLREAGLIEARAGSGTFVAEPAPGEAGRAAAMRRLGAAVEALIADAERDGLSTADVAMLVQGRAARGRPAAPRGLVLLMVGIFAEATQGYAARIAEHLDPADRIDATTLSDLRDGGASAARQADLCVTLANRRTEVEALVPRGTPVVGLSFIPSEETRARLAAIDPMARLGIVSVFPEFLALMKPGVLRFTPHVSDARVAMLSDPALDDFLAEVDVAVYATGAEAVRERLPAGRTAIEYRHVPDPHAIRNTLLPLVERLRGGPEATGTEREGS